MIAGIAAGVFAGLIMSVCGIATAMEACGGSVACPVEDGSYRALPPDGWDGRSPLTTAFFFHGYGSSAADAAETAGLVRPFAERGVLLVLPDGRNGSWSHTGSPSRDRDDVAFVGRVLDDVMRRWPVAQDRILATGFSQGGSMVWELACRLDQRFTAFFAISGAFWLPQPEACPSGPVWLRHEHGQSDLVVPLEGRAIRRVFRQADVFEGMAFWRAHDACDGQPSEIRSEGVLICRRWDDCGTPGRLTLCLHDGGHRAVDGWVERSLDWLDRAAQIRRPPGSG